MKSNEWLTKESFLEDVIFHDKYYFQSLCLCISNFVKNVPLPVMTSWDYKHSQIYFFVGKEKKTFYVNVNVAYDDYIYMVEKWLRRLYPQYNVELSKEISLSDAEVLEKVQEDGLSMNDALLIKKEIKHKEFGIIERVYFKGTPEDTFKLNVNGNLSIRMSGTVGKEYPLSIFLPDFRKIGNDIDRRDFIYGNSIEIKVIEEKEKVKKLNYLGMQMRSFVEIRGDGMKKEVFKKMDTRKWRWGDFILNMETDILENDILEILRDKNVEIVDETLK